MCLQVSMGINMYEYIISRTLSRESERYNYSVYTQVTGVVSDQRTSANTASLSVCVHHASIWMDLTCRWRLELASRRRGPIQTMLGKLDVSVIMSFGHLHTKHEWTINYHGSQD